MQVREFLEQPLRASFPHSAFFEVQDLHTLLLRLLLRTYTVA